jgi:hypothetical protein
MRRRLSRLEAKAGIGLDPSPSIFLWFGDSPDRAESNGRAWQREPGEVADQFGARILADLESAGPGPPFLVLMFDKEHV